MTEFVVTIADNSSNAYTEHGLEEYTQILLAIDSIKSRIFTPGQTCYTPDGNFVVISSNNVYEYYVMEFIAQSGFLVRIDKPEKFDDLITLIKLDPIKAIKYVDIQYKGYSYGKESII